MKSRISTDQDRETSATEIDKMRSAGPSINRMAVNKKGRSDREAQLRRWLRDGLSWKHTTVSSPALYNTDSVLPHELLATFQSQNQQCLFLALHYDFSKSSEIWSTDSLEKTHQNKTQKSRKQNKTRKMAGFKQQWDGTKLDSWEWQLPNPSKKREEWKQVLSYKTHDFAHSGNNLVSIL